METLNPQNLDENKNAQTGEVEIPRLPPDSVTNSFHPASEVERITKRHSRLLGKTRRLWAIVALLTYLAGLGSGYVMWGKQAAANPANSGGADQVTRTEMEAMAAQINPKDGYKIPVSYGDIGPKLLAAGAIDLDQFVKLYQEIGRPLSKEQLAILTEGSRAPVVINPDNQQFLLNLFWAFGLANQNRILTDGPMMREGKEGVVNFASTGGWTIAAKPVKDLYASRPLVRLTEEQQKRLEEVAQGVYRPCCDNPTHFPDCNHGMAMLGVLELMASQEASVDQMFQAAKYVNAYWFPQQTLEMAVAFKTAKNVNFEQADARQMVGQSMSSGSGFQSVHQWLVQNGKLEQAPQGGGSCGVK